MIRVTTHQVAIRGLADEGSNLPHLSTIQKAFGKHDVTGIKAHVAGPAARSCNDMRAEAYASGEHIAFARAPDLHTAAHETAHVVQQRAGVQLQEW